MTGHGLSGGGRHRGGGGSARETDDAASRSSQSGDQWVERGECSATVEDRRPARVTVHAQSTPPSTMTACASAYISIYIYIYKAREKVTVYIHTVSSALLNGVATAAG